MRYGATALIGLLLATGTPAHAADDSADGGWKFEITPYLWLAGIDGDVTVQGTKVHVSQSFSDLVESVSAGAMLLGIVQYDHLVGLVQLDYIATDTNNLDPRPAAGRLESTFFMTNLGVGYQFGGWFRGSTLDLLLGARILSLDSKVTPTGSGSIEKTSTLADPVLFVRPSLRLLSWLRFNPTVSIGGGGSSELTYELQPTLQFQILDNLAARVGYRRVYYRYTGPIAKFEGSLSGFLVGLGVTF